MDRSRDILGAAAGWLNPVEALKKGVELLFVPLLRRPAPRGRPVPLRLGTCTGSDELKRYKSVL